jgi:hypothetical protein
MVLDMHDARAARRYTLGPLTRVQFETLVRVLRHGCNVRADEAGSVTRRASMFRWTLDEADAGELLDTLAADTVDTLRVVGQCDLAQLLDDFLGRIDSGGFDR